MATRRVREVATLFGLDPRRGAAGPPRWSPHALPAARSITFVTGHSGAGKSTLLRHMAETWRHAPAVRLMRLEQIRLPANRALVDCFRLPLRQTLAVLARAGLAEARLFILPPASLSVGEQFRYRLAAWMARATQERVLHLLIADEFCSCLDRITACAVAWQFQKAIRAADGISRAAVLATAHGDLIADLRPDVTIWKELGIGAQAGVMKGEG